METSNHRADQARTTAQTPQQPIDATETAGAISETGETGEWRFSLPPESRQKIVNKIMETLKKHLPSPAQESMLELMRIAAKFEEKIYLSSTSQPDYLKNISVKMLTIERITKGPHRNDLLHNPGSSHQNAADSVSGDIQAQVHNPSQQLPMPIMGNQSQARQQLLPQNVQNNMKSTGMQNSASITTAPLEAGGMARASLPNVNGRNSNLQGMENISNVALNSMANSMGQGMQSNMSVNNQRQMPGRQQQVVSQQSQQPQQQPQNAQKFTHGSMPQSLVQQQPHIQQQHQQRQNLSRQSQHTLMQSTMIPSPPLSNLQQNQQSSTEQSGQTMLPHHSQPSMQQQQQRQLQQQQQRQHTQQSTMIHPQTSLTQHPMLASHQQQQRQPVGQPPSVTNFQQKQMSSMPNSIHDIRQQPAQPQRTVGQQSNMSNVQQLHSQQGNFSNMHQQQPPKTIGLESHNTGMPRSQQNVYMLHQSRVTAQQPLQQSAGLIPSQGQQSQQMQLPQQQLMSQNQSQPAQVQQQIGDLQQQANTLPRDRTSSPLLHHQNVVDLQKQLFQPQRQIPNGPSTPLDAAAQTGSDHGGDWQEEAYQKIRSLKETYFVSLNVLYQRISAKLRLDLQHQPNNEHIEKLKFFRIRLEKLLLFLRLNKNDIKVAHRDQIGQCEKQIVNFLKSRPRNPNTSWPQGQLTQSGVHAMQQNQQSESQISQMQPHESQISSQMESSMSVQGSVVPMQQNSLANLQRNSLPSRSNISNPQQSMVNSIHSRPGLDAMQGNAQNSLQQVALIRQNPVSGSQQMNINPQASQNGMRTMQSNLNPLHQNSNMIQHQQVTQKQQISQTQHLEQFQQRPELQQQPRPQILLQKQSPAIVLSPSTPLAPSPMLAETEKLNTGVSLLLHTGANGHQQETVPSPPAQSLAISTPGISASPLLAESTSPDGTPGVGDGKPTAVERPHERLMRGLKSISSKALIAAVSEISSVVSMVYRIAESAEGNGSKAAVGEDLVAMTNCRLQSRNFHTQEGPPASKRMRLYTSATPSNAFSSVSSVLDSYRQINSSEASDSESTATSGVKRPLVEVHQALIQEMREINRRLIDTTVEISNKFISAAEGDEGTIVKCSYNAVALCPNLKALYASAQISPIQPLRFLVPNSYPYCSPILLDNFTAESSSGCEDLSMKAKSKFSLSFRSLSQPMSLSDVARVWDVCARAVMTEYAQQFGGGTFSSKYGFWENCPTAA